MNDNAINAVTILLNHVDEGSDLHRGLQDVLKMIKNTFPEDYEMLASENKFMADFLSKIGYKQSEISDIASTGLPGVDVRGVENPKFVVVVDHVDGPCVKNCSSVQEANEYVCGIADVSSIEELQKGLDSNPLEAFNGVISFKIDKLNIDAEYGRDEFMEFFRSDRFHEEMSPDDCKEVFSQVLHGNSDFSKELLDQTLGDYDLGVLSLYSNEDLAQELKERGILISDEKLSVVKHRVERLQKQIEDIDKRHKGQEQKLTYHAGFDNGYLKGKLAVYEDLFEFDPTNKSKMESEINNYPPVEVHLTSFYKTGVNGISTRAYSSVDEIDLSDKYLFTMRSDFSNSLIDRLVNVYQNDPKIHINKTLQLHFEDSAIVAGRKFEVVNKTLAHAVLEVQSMGRKANDIKPV